MPDRARQIRADDPLTISATDRKHPLGIAGGCRICRAVADLQVLQLRAVQWFDRVRDNVVIFRNVRGDIFQRNLGIRML